MHECECVSVCVCVCVVPPESKVIRVINGYWPTQVTVVGMTGNFYKGLRASTWHNTCFSLAQLVAFVARIKCVAVLTSITFWSDVRPRCCVIFPLHEEWGGGFAGNTTSVLPGPAWRALGPMSSWLTWNWIIEPYWMYSMCTYVLIMIGENKAPSCTWWIMHSATIHRSMIQLLPGWTSMDGWMDGWMV